MVPRAGARAAGRVDQGWGAALGYPALVLDPDGPAVDVQVPESADLARHWARLHEFEGPAYERVLTAVSTRAGTVEAYLYVLPTGSDPIGS